MRRSLLIGLILCFSLPSAVQAAVTINEVAWMGSVASANHEWIELYNDGASAVDLTDWILTDNLNLSITLAGQVPAGGYAVLERSSDESAPGSAFLLYTGALVNTGASLTLQDASGQTMDVVAGGENWSAIGGDNVTKETAQYTSHGWVTDAPTPGRINGAGTVVKKEEDETTDTTSSTGSITTKKINKGDNSKTVPLVQSTAVLALTISAQTIAYVHQTVTFTTVPKNIGETIMDSLVYTWNFGDSYSATGTSPQHRYDYPGTYVVTARAVYGRHDVVVRHEITVLPVTLALARSEAGDVQIQNNSPYDVDISGYTLHGAGTVTLPPFSIILPRSTVTIRRSRLETGAVGSSLLALYDDTKTLVASTYQEASRRLTERSSANNNVGLDLAPTTVQPVPTVVMSPRIIPTAAAPATAAFNFVGAKVAVMPSVVAVAEASSTSDVSDVSGESEILPPTAVKQSDSDTRPLWTYCLLAGLVGIALVTINYAPRKVD